MIRETLTLVPTNSVGRMFVPTDNRLAETWQEPGFDDSNWRTVTMGVGYDRSPAGSGNTPPPIESLADMTQPSDFIVATSPNSPGNEGVENAIDDKSATKYLNFDKFDAGFTVAPENGLSVITGLRLTSANDAPDRDPANFILSGSIDGQTFEQIARGSVPVFSGRFVSVVVTFANNKTYSQYRLLFPNVRNAAAAVAVQIAEVEFLGTVGPPSPSFREIIASSIEPELFGRGSSANLRFPFFVEQLQNYENLALRVRYDDGFVARLNGVQVARANAPQTLSYSSSATTDRSRSTAVVDERFDLSHYSALIRDGDNLLTIQGLNDRASSPDFLIQAQIENTRISLGETSYLESPTPERFNAPAILDFVQEPVPSHERGFYESPINVELLCATPGAVIRFTTDGAPPSNTSGTAYTGPIRVDRTTVLRAAAFRADWRPSRVITHTFLFLDDISTQNRARALAAGFPSSWNFQSADYGLDMRVVNPAGSDSYGGKYTRTFKEDLKTLPTLSIVMPIDDLFGPQGVYSNPLNRGAAWERAASIELIYPDLSEGFQEDAGIRIQGGAFRRWDLTLKKSFRVIFREEYGDTVLRYPLFGPNATSEFNNIVLRANSNDAWPYAGGSVLYVRDAFAMDTAREMGIVAPHSNFAHLYLNGHYWGLYNPVERPDAAFSATYFGGDRDSWDAINQDSAPDGTYDAWNRLVAQLRQDLSQNTTYQRNALLVELRCNRENCDSHFWAPPGSATGFMPAILYRPPTGRSLNAETPCPTTKLSKSGRRSPTAQPLAFSEFPSRERLLRLQR